MACIKADIGPPTGPMRFGDDWPGIFIRGDNALWWALVLKRATKALEDDTDPLLIEHIHELAELMESCQVDAPQEDDR